jgi:coenzyme F420-reducing hydrogenase alpha subunit
MTKLSVHHIARIEGHATIELAIEGKEIRTLELKAVEPQRFFETLVCGRQAAEVPLIVSRICGICSPNHTVTALMALESALGIEVSERTRQLRLLLVYGSFLQNHATHLYLLAAPDYLGLPTAFLLAESAPAVLARALRLKALGNRLTTAIGGRAVHPATAVLGGFTQEPEACVLRVLAADVRAAVHDAAETVELFASFPLPDLHSDREMLALYEAGEYAITTGMVRARRAGWQRPVADYAEFIHEESVPYGNAKFSSVDGAPFMTGALARVNLSWNGLKASARVAAASAGLRPAEDNPFRNNVCQALELVDAAERCAELCEYLAEGESGYSAPEAVVPVAGRGAAASEAPRGTLYHRYELDAAGRVTAGDVITPTAQNLACLEADLRDLVPLILDLPEKEFLLTIEQLIRAYDPCLSCAVH